MGRLRQDSRARALYRQSMIVRLMGRLLATCLAFPAFAAATEKASVPLTVEDHRLFIDAQFTRSDGSLRSARLWVDTGTPDFQITENLAKDLGLDISGPKMTSEDGVPQVPVQLPGLQIGGMRLDLHGQKPMVVLGEHGVFAGSRTDGNLPATVLKHYQLVLDILHQRMILLQPGSGKAKGRQIPCLVQPETGMVQIQTMINGQHYSLALDSGAPYSMISSEAIQDWSKQHTDWPKVLGAAGPATLFGIPRLLRDAPMMRIPQIGSGKLLLKHVGFLGMDPEFVSWYSKKTAAPVIGFLSWNVLKAFQVTIDYPHSAVYFERQGNIDAHDMDVAGLALAESRSGGYAIVSIVRKDGHPTVEQAQPGDKLLEVDGVDVTHVGLQRVVDALGGHPGTAHTILVNRKGRRLTIKAKTMRLL